MIRRLAGGVASSGGIRLRRDIIHVTTRRHQLNVELHTRSFGAPVTSESSSPCKACRKVTREERQALVESFVEKFRVANGGKFPGIDFTRRQVGGSYYVIRDMVLKLKCQPKASCGNNREVSLENEGKPIALSSHAEEQVVAEESLNSSTSGDCQLVEQPCNVDFFSIKDADRLKANDIAVYNPKPEPPNPDSTKTSEVDQDLCSENATILNFGASPTEDRVISVDPSENKEQSVGMVCSSELSDDGTLRAEESVTYSEVVHSNEQPCNADFNSVKNTDGFNEENFKSVEDTDIFDMNKIQRGPLHPARAGSSEVDQDFCDGNRRISSSEVSTTEERVISVDASANKGNFVSTAHFSKHFVDETAQAEGVISHEAASSSEQCCNTDFYLVEDADSSNMKDFSLVRDTDSFKTVADKTRQKCHSSDSLPFKADQDLCQQSRIVHSKGAGTAEKAVTSLDQSMTENSAGVSVSSSNVESKDLLHSSLPPGASTFNASSHKNVKEELQHDCYQDPKSNDSGRNLGGKPDIKETAGTKSSVWSDIKSLAGSIVNFWRKL